MPAGRPDDPGIWLLELEVGGHVYRFATEAVVLEDLQGRTFEYLEGLAELDTPFGAVTAGVGTAEVSVSVSSAVDWAQLVARGHALDRCPAVVRRWYGGTLERARVLLHGLTASPTYGGLGEDLELDVRRNGREQTGAAPPAQAVVDATTWPVTGGHSVPDKALGQTYPIVIGAPGGTEDATPVCVVPVPQAEWKSGAVLASKVVWLGGHAGQVRIRCASDDPPTELDAAVSTKADLLGRIVQWAPPGDDNDEGEYYLGFRDDDVYGGGLVAPRGGLLRGAGDVIEWVLRTYYKGAVDWGRLSAVRAYLNAWKIDTWIDGATNMWEWLGRAVLPLLPVELREGEQGVYPALLRYDLTKADAVARLVADDRVERRSALSLVGTIANEITVEYRPTSEAQSKWLARRVLTASSGVLTGADATPETDTRLLSSVLCAESQRRYDEVIPLRIQADAVWDTATAVLIAQHTAAQRALPRRAVTYGGGPWLEGLEVGQAVLVTDAEVHLEDELALVMDVVPEAGGAAVDLLLLDRPALRRRSTS